MPLDARSFGGSIVGFIDNLFLFVLTKSIPSLTKMIGLEGLFAIFFVVTSVCMVLSYFYLPETHGLTAEEIGEIYKKKNVVNEKKMFMK